MQKKLLRLSEKPNIYFCVFSICFHIDPPSWVTRPTDQTVIQAATVTFHCSASGNPVPTIVWLKGGKTVGTGNTLSFKTSRNQSGEYWCSAENALKTVNTNVSLNVQCKYGIHACNDDLFAGFHYPVPRVLVSLD